MELNNDNYPEYIKKYGFEYFYELLKNNKYLTEFYSYNIDLDIKLNIKFLTESLKTNKHLLILSLHHCVNNKDAEFISELLKINKSIEYLNLCNNYITDKGIEFIADALKINKYLMNLDLSYNKINDNGIKYIIDALKINKSLMILDLSFTYISCKGTEFIIDLFKINKSLIQLYLHGNKNVYKDKESIIIGLLEINRSIREKNIKDRAEEKVLLFAHIQNYHWQLEFLEFFDICY